MKPEIAGYLLRHGKLHAGPIAILEALVAIHWNQAADHAAVIEERATGDVRGTVGA